jgi:hypothetical protein
MRKPTLLLVIFVLSVINIFGRSIPENVASTVAGNKIIQLQMQDKFQVLPNPVIFVNKLNQKLFYLFQLSPAGYMAITTKDELPAVIAYSFTGDFSAIIEGNNPLTELLQKDIELRIANIGKTDKSIIEKRKAEWNDLISGKTESKFFQQWPPEGTTSTGGWLETNWKQSYPYNKFCPMDPVTSQRSYVGCPATAMAQIVNYYETFNETVFTDDDDYYHSYAGRNFWIDDDYEEHDFLSFPQINNYLDSATINYQSGKPLTTDEVAALSFACGVAAHQVYTSEVSGTFGVDQALDAYLKFGFEDAVLMDETDTSIFTIVKQNMMEARPSHLALVNESWTVGHNLVLDGYNTDDYYHINFGWGGGYNGWYYLPDENMPYGLTVIEGVIANISYPPLNTGMNDGFIESFHSDLDIYPNPASGIVTITFDLQKGENYILSITDLSGKEIFRSVEKPVINKDRGEYIIDANRIDSMAPGIYIINIKTDSKLLTGKLIVK